MRRPTIAGWNRSSSSRFDPLVRPRKQMKVLALFLISGAYAFAQDQTAIEVKPATPVIQDKDLWERTGPLPSVQAHAAVRGARPGPNLTSPFHTAKSDIKWWAIFGGATAAPVATDRWTVQQLPNSSSQVSVSNWASRLGSAYTLIPVSAGFYLIGSKRHDERFRETGLIAFETLDRLADRGNRDQDDRGPRPPGRKRRDRPISGQSERSLELELPFRSRCHHLGAARP